jgi:hypothetical protein
MTSSRPWNKNYTKPATGNGRLARGDLRTLSPRLHVPVGLGRHHLYGDRNQSSWTGRNCVGNFTQPRGPRCGRRRSDR